MSRGQLFRFFFIGVFLFLLYQTLHILSPFYTGILGAIVVALIFFPLYRFILNKIGPHRANMASSLATLLVVVTLLIPFITFTWFLLNELTTIGPIVERITAGIDGWRQGNVLVEIQWLKPLQNKLESIFNLIQLDWSTMIRHSANDLINSISGLSKKLPQNIFIFSVNVLVMIITLFFLFRDGPVIFMKLKDLVPMDEKHKEHIAEQLYLTVTAVVRGIFIVAITQGSLAGFGFFISGTPSPTLLGLFTTFTAMIPFVGATAIWMPIAVYYLAQGSMVKGIFLFFWGAFVVSLIDNFIRPIIIGSRAKLPILFLFFGLLGGIKIYGAMGIFLGPLIVALLIAFIKIYREEFHPQTFAKKNENG